MTKFAEAKAALKPLNVTVTRRIEGGEGRDTRYEYRVNLKGGTEVSAYYTTDLSDALETGRAMAARRNPHVPSTLERSGEALAKRWAEEDE